MIKRFDGDLVYRCYGAMVICLNVEINPKFLFGDMVIWCDSILLGQTCNATCFIRFLNNWKILGDLIFRILML